MDPYHSLLMETRLTNSYGQADYRRNYTLEDRQRLCEWMSDDLGFDEETRDACRREERLAQACYE